MIHARIIQITPIDSVPRNRLGIVRFQNAPGNVKVLRILQSLIDPRLQHHRIHPCTSLPVLRLSSLLRPIAMSLSTHTIVSVAICKEVVLFYLRSLLFAHGVEVNTALHGVICPETARPPLILLHYHTLPHLLRHNRNVQKPLKRRLVALGDARQLEGSEERIQLGLAVGGEGGLEEACFVRLGCHSGVNRSIDSIVMTCHWTAKCRQLLREVVEAVEALVLLLNNVLLGTHAVLHQLHFVHFGVLRRLCIGHKIDRLRHTSVPCMLRFIIMKRHFEYLTILLKFKC